MGTGVPSAGKHDLIFFLHSAQLYFGGWCQEERSRASQSGISGFAPRTTGAACTEERNMHWRQTPTPGTVTSCMRPFELSTVQTKPKHFSSSMILRTGWVLSPSQSVCLCGIPARKPRRVQISPALLLSSTSSRKRALSLRYKLFRNVSVCVSMSETAN